ncbi:MAG: nickel pincer cofactor biosynthesis protein LarC [Firmicutes bacterium]|nr:nickel pincer cofactor biosynthesis protein LarC [Bacillota bacterium]
MNTLYLDCAMGAAGDMLAAALYEIYPDQAGFLRALNGAGIPGLTARVERDSRGGVCGSRFRVSIDGTEEEAAAPAGHDHEHGHGHEHHHEHEHGHEHGHSHASLPELRVLIAGLDLPEQVKADVAAVYGLIAEAESAVHGRPVEQVHFHEVGALDAVADVAAVSLLIRGLAPDRVLASPIHVGSGTVRCAHGVLPVPAPATARLLLGLPIYGGNITGELCTPTGAALLRHFVQEFAPLPLLRAESIGCGLGSREIPEAPNCLRALWGHSPEQETRVWEISCNLDDMTGEELGFAQEKLWEAGALDVYTVPIGMKKNRPGVLLCCLCREDGLERVRDTLFRHTTTWGLRVKECRRFQLERRSAEVTTPAGQVRIKRGGDKAKPEYEDLARIARERDITLAEARRLAEAAVTAEEPAE